jgi:predicted phage-related endonuclease
MGKQIIPFTGEAAWLEARMQDVTSTEVAALFNASPYLTAFELFHAKRSGVVEARADNPRMRWGRRLQDPIAHGVAEDNGMEIRKMSEYIRDPDVRAGASFDFQIVGARGTGPKPEWAHHLMLGAGIMEIKTVDPAVMKEQWVIVDGEVIEAPPHIELQVQQQLLVSGMQWALIVALVGGNRVSTLGRAYDPKLGAAILAKVREFWQLVDAGTAPTPDYTRDAELIARQHVNAIAGKVLDARDDSDLAMWVNEYQSLGKGISAYIEERDAMRARILERIGDAARVQLPDAILSAGTVKESIVPQHTRAPYRALRISRSKP